MSRVNYGKAPDVVQTLLYGQDNLISLCKNEYKYEMFSKNNCIDLHT